MIYVVSGEQESMKKRIAGHGYRIVPIGLKIGPIAAAGKVERLR